MGLSPESENGLIKKNWKSLSLLLLALVLVLSACSQPASKPKEEPTAQPNTETKSQTIVGKWLSPEFEEMMGLESLETYFGEGVVVSFQFTQEGKMLDLVNDKPVKEAAQEALKDPALTEGVREALSGMESSDISVSYKLEGDKMLLTTDYGTGKLEETWGYQLDGDKLILTIDDKPVHFDRMK